MKKSHLLFAMVAMLATFSSPSRAGTIGIDFGCSDIEEVWDCIEGDDPLQDGYVGWVGPHTGNPGLDYNETRSFNADFALDGTFDLNITSDGLFFREYGFTPSSGSPFVSQTNLLADNINRNQPGSIVFTFSGLAPGSYIMNTFHHDSLYGSTIVPFNINVSDALGARTVASSLDTSGGYDPDAITTALFDLTVGTNNLATITFFTNYADGGEHMSINGFQLTGAATIPLPPALHLFGAGLLGLIGVAGRKETAKYPR